MRRECPRRARGYRSGEPGVVDDDTLQVALPRATASAVVVTLTRDPRERDGVKWACSESEDAEMWCGITDLCARGKGRSGWRAPPEEECRGS